MAKNEKNEVAKVVAGELVDQRNPNQALSTEMRPDFLKDEKVEGTGNITSDDIQMPRLQIAQLTSPEIDKLNNLKFIEGLEFGNFFNNLTQTIYGDGPLEFCVLRSDKPRYVEFIPLEAGGGVRDPKVPANDPRTQFGPNGEKPIATKFYDYVIMLLPSRELIAISFKSTALKTAKQLNAMITMRGASIYMGKYSLESVATSNKKGRYAVPVVRGAGWIVQKKTEELYALAKGAFENLAGKQITFDTEQPADEFEVEALEREAALQREQMAQRQAEDNDPEPVGGR